VSDAPVVNHVGLCVSNLERARRFYTEALGFQQWFEFQQPDQPSDRLLGLPPPLGMTCVYLRKGEFVLELLSYADAGTAEPRTRAMNEPGLTHVSFAVDDLADTCARVERLGGEVLADTNIGTAVFVRDPDSQLVELLPMSYRGQLPQIVVVTD